MSGSASTQDRPSFTTTALRTTERIGIGARTACRRCLRVPQQLSIRETVLATLRPFLAPLDATMRGTFTAKYIDEIRLAYPARSDGRVMLKFRACLLSPCDRAMR